MKALIEGKGKRGLASCTSEVRHRVAQAGGNALHKVRGLQAVSPELRSIIARKGGLSRGEQVRKERNVKQSNPLREPENVMAVPQTIQ
ncbi:MAG: hypothetical protein JRN15_04455 [Nitrososphaerota archaeon]|nr:hypothetical protein [Nitrososphaerota archaeon]